MSLTTPHSPAFTTALPIATRIVLLPATPLAVSPASTEPTPIIALELASARLAVLPSRPGSETLLATSICAYPSVPPRFSEIPQAIVSAFQSAPPTFSHKTIRLDNALLVASPDRTAITSPAFSTPWIVLPVHSPTTPPIYAMSATLLLELGAILFQSDA